MGSTLLGRQPAGTKRNPVASFFFFLKLLPSALRYFNPLFIKKQVESYQISNYEQKIGCLFGLSTTFFKGAMQVHVLACILLHYVWKCHDFCCNSIFPHRQINISMLQSIHLSPICVSQPCLWGALDWSFFVDCGCAYMQFYTPITFWCTLVSIFVRKYTFCLDATHRFVNETPGDSILWFGFVVNYATWPTDKVPGHLLILLYTADIRQLQQRIDVVRVQL